MDIIRNIGCALFTTFCFAQEETDHTLMYQEYNDNLSVQSFILNTSNSFKLNYNDQNLRVDVEPNKKTTLGISAQYDIVFLSIGFAPAFFEDNRDNADSKMISFAMDAFPGRFVQHFDFYYQKGLSLKSDNVNLYFKDLKSMKIGGSTGFIFNKAFSYRAVNLQNAKQIKSAGSFVPALSYYYTELNGKNQQGFGSKDYFIDVAISPTYHYNLVIAKDFLLSAGLGIGIGATFSDESSSKVLYQASAQLGFGYNTKRFFAGVMSHGLVSSHSASSDVIMDDSVSYATAFIGYRFDAPYMFKKIKKNL